MAKNLSEALAETGTMFKSQFATKEQVKGKASRSEAKVKKAVRAACVARDGYCLVRTRTKGCVVPCKGRSEWAHLAGHRRSQTRGLPPSIRHDTRWTAMLCKRHHTLEEDDQWRVVYHTTQYADGRVSWEPV